MEGERKPVSHSVARWRGMPTYWTGEPCTRGHVAERWVSSRCCTVCANENNAFAYHVNKESRRKQVRESVRRVGLERTAARQALKELGVALR